MIHASLPPRGPALPLRLLMPLLLLVSLPVAARDAADAAPGRSAGTVARAPGAQESPARPVHPPEADHDSPTDLSEGFDDITLLPGLGWFFQNNSQPPGVTGWFQGNDGVFPAHAGPATSYIGANFNSTSGTGTISNWMLTPEVALADSDTVSFWTRTVEGSSWADRLQVRLSTNGGSTNVGTTATDVGDFTTLLLDINPTYVPSGYPPAWTQYTITLTGIPPGATGRIAFRYFVENGGPTGANSNYIGIDSFELAGTPDIALSPPSLLALLPPDSVVTEALAISNLGSGDLAWDITEDAGLQPGGSARVAPARLLRPNDRSPVPPPNEISTGEESLSRAQLEGPARRVAPPVSVAPEGTITITHSVTQNLVAGNSVACNTGGQHSDNSYLRAFDLAAFGITGQLAVTEVQVGIETATGATGTQPATVNLHTWDPADPFTFANFVLIGTVNLTVTDQALTILTVPITATAPAGSTLVVELFTPDGRLDGNALFVGSNPDGQTAPSYIAAAPCGIPEPTDLAVLGFPNMHVVMNVTGSVGCDVDLPWVSENPTSGVTGPGGTSSVDVTFDSTGLLPGSTHTGALCIDSNDPDTPQALVPLTLEVDGMPFVDGFETGDTSRWSSAVP